jgi:hypothetical protein
MSLGIVVTNAPGVGRARLGKLVKDSKGRGVYCFDNATSYRKLDAFGVALCVLVEMLRYGYTDIVYSFAYRTWATTVKDVLRYGIDDPNPTRRGYIYLPVRKWQIIPAPKFGWISDSVQVPLEWADSSPYVTRLRQDAREAARPAAVQMGFAAMGA